MRKWWPLILITIVSGILRFFDLSHAPSSLNWDEVSHGYNAYSILKTGSDEWGKTFPLIFRAFGDYKLPIYIYATILPIFIFGLNTFAVRFASALAGTLAIPGIFLLANYLWPEKSIKLGKSKISLGLISAFLLGITPWHFFISRPALEANLSLTLIIFGFYFLLRGLQNSRFLIPGSLLLGLSLHTYNTSRVFVPTLILFTVFIFKKQIKLSKFTFISLAIFMSFISIVGVQLFTGEATARYKKLEILSENTIFQIGEQRSISKLPPVVARLVHNRPVFFTKTVISNYLSYFSPQFLYQGKGVQTQFAIPDKNLFTLSITLLAIVGIISVLLHSKTKSDVFILAWFLVSPLAASLTADPPQALRPNPMIPAVIAFSSIGLLVLISKLKGFLKTFTFLIILLSCSVSFIFYLKTFYGEYAHYYSDSWQYGYQEAVDFINKEGSKYDRVVFTKAYGEPHIFYAFFSQLDPSLLQPSENNIRFEQSEWFWTDRIGKVYFVNQWDIPERGKSVDKFVLESGIEIPARRSLLVTTFNYLPDNAHVEKIIEFVDGRIAFIIASIP